VHLRHVDVSDGDRDMVRGEQPARCAWPLERKVGRAYLEIVLCGLGVSEHRVAEHRGEKVPRALNLRHIKLDVVDPIEFQRSSLRRRARGGEQGGPDGIERLSAREGHQFSINPLGAPAGSPAGKQRDCLNRTWTSNSVGLLRQLSILLVSPEPRSKCRRR